MTTDAARFIEGLRHFKGRWAGERFTLLPWESDIIEKVFGTFNPDGSRRYRTVYIEVPRKNGKTTLSAAIALYLLCADGEPGAEVYSAAKDRDQAGLVYEAASKMTRASGLDGRLRPIDSQKRILHYPSASYYRAIPADAAGSWGFNAHGVIIDEFHVQPNRELYDALTTSVGARTQPLTWIITTAGYDRESICWEVHEYARQVKEGLIDDPTFLPVMYGAPDDADWTDPEVWAKANPSLGHTITFDFLAQECEKAKQLPNLQNTFRRVYLNQWTQQATRWLDLRAWDATASIVDRLELKGRECFAGMDLSSTTDIAALSLVFPPDPEGPGGAPFETLVEFWIPEENMRERVQRDRVPYDSWVRQGFIKSTPGNVIDYGFIRQRLNELSKEFDIREVAYDPWNATQLSLELQDDGFTMVETRQGYKTMSPAAKELERLVLSRCLAHGGNPVLRWMADNVVVIQDPAGNIKPDKSKSTNRIDGIVALMMALYRATLHYPTESVYEGRGLRTV